MRFTAANSFPVKLTNLNFPQCKTVPLLQKYLGQGGISFAAS
jgi:hypothetical protein